MMTIDKHRNPLSFSYIRILGNVFLGPVGAWPIDMYKGILTSIGKFHKFFVPFQAAISSFAELNYIFTYSDTMSVFDIGHCLITTFLTVVILVRTLLPWSSNYEKIIKQYLNNFHLVHFRHMGDYYNKVYIYIDKLSYLFSLFVMVTSTIGCALFNLVPIYQNYINGIFTEKNLRVENNTVEFAVYYKFPGVNPENHFYGMMIFNFYQTVVCAICICSIDLLMSLFIFNIIGHIQILIYNLEIFQKPEKHITINFETRNNVIEAEMFDKEENKVLHKELSECIEHHKMIITFTRLLSDTFGPMLAFNYLFHLVGCCLLLLECSQGDAHSLFRFGPLTVIVFNQLIQISVTFEIVGFMSEKLKDSVYYLPWEYMDVRNRRTVCFLLKRVQKPIYVSAMGGTSVGVTAMTSILKTTFSFFTYLRSMNK